MALNFDAINLFDFVVKQGNGIKGLVDSGISEVPELYIKPAHERFKKTNTTASQLVQLPLIDLSGLDEPQHDQVEKAIVKAAETFGFFYVMNHGLPIHLLEEMKDAAHKFFNQPAEKKSVYLRGVSPSPLVNYGTSFVPEKDKSFEWKDYFSMYYTSDDDALKYWPDQCREAALNYLKASTMTARRIMETLLKNIGVEPADIMAETLTRSRVVNMNYYPTCPDPRLTVGIGRHSDIGTMTVLLQDDVGGLSVRVQEDGNDGNNYDEWLEIPPIPGALIINIGDCLQILSNGKYKSAEHRARTTSTRSRVSVPLLLSPGPKEILRPLPQVVEKDGKPQYKECLFEDYMNNYFGHAYQGKKGLDFVKITSP